ncbi:MAG TPA: N-acetylmuramoyl-L-alanine amidase, partial [Chloroflexota bacterium]
MRRLFVVLLLLAFPQIALAQEAAPPDASPARADVGLDPGHSVADVGAVGGGLAEYEVTLDIANRVRAILEENGLSVVMSRHDDQPLTDFSAPDPTDAVRIEQEARIAAVGGARLYVSIHLNGFPAPSVRGMEVY